MAMARHPCLIGGRPGGPKLPNNGLWLTDEHWLVTDICPPVARMAEADHDLDLVTRKCTGRKCLQVGGR